MFCIKCGKNLEKPGICRFCGENNNIVCENSFFDSPEIETLFQDDEDYLLMKEDSAPVKKIHKDSEPLKQKLHIRDDATANESENPAESAKNAAKSAPALSGTSVSEKISITDAAPEAEVSEPAVTRETKDQVPKTDSDPKGAAMPDKVSSASGKSRFIVILAVLLIVAVVVICIFAVKNKKNKNEKGKTSSSSYDSSDKENPTGIPGESAPENGTASTENPSEPEESTVPEETTNPEATTDPDGEESRRDTVNAAVIETIDSQMIYSDNDGQIVDAMVNDLLTPNGYNCVKVDIADNNINPSEYDMVILPMPVHDLNDIQIKKLERFLENKDKNLLYIPALFNAETPEINDFLAEWDIGVDNEEYVFYTDIPGNYLNEGKEKDGCRIMLSVDNKEAAGGSDYESDKICAPYTKSVIALKKEVKSVLSVPEESKLVDNDTGAPASGDSETSRCAAVISANSKKSNIIVFGSSQMFSSQYMNSDQYANKDVILSILNTAAGMKNSYSHEN